MFNSITLGTSETLVNPSIDVGLLAECLLFYGKVRVITTPITFKSLVRTCGANELLELCDMGALEIEFMENMTAVSSVETNVGVCHDLGLVAAASMKFSPNARAAADEEGAGSTRVANRLFERFQRAVQRTQYDKEVIKGSQEDLRNRLYLEAAVEKTLAFLVPQYTPPSPLVFRPRPVENFGIRYETNVDFDEANKLFHCYVSPKDATLSPAYILAHITSAEPDIVYASRGGSEFAVGELKSAIVSSRVAGIVAKATAGKERLDVFQESVVSGSRSVREAVNIGDRNFADVVRLTQRAHKFKAWIRDTGEDAALRDEYCKQVAATDWADTLPPKSVRFAVMSGLSVLAGLALTPAAGAITGVGLNAADYFLLDRLLKGWKPNQFVEGSLRSFLKEK